MKNGFLASLIDLGSALALGYELARLMELFNGVNQRIHLTSAYVSRPLLFPILYREFWREITK